MSRNNFKPRDDTTACNLIRFTQCILCLICLTLAIYILLEIPRIHVVLKTLLILTAATFFFITFVDIIVTSLLKPLLWTSWIMFALMGALAFFLCTGLVMFKLDPLGMDINIGALIANCVTGIAFLLEVLCIISWLVSRCAAVGPNKEKSNTSFTTSTTSKMREATDTVDRKDKANQFPGDDMQFPENDKSIQCRYDILRKGKFTCTKETCPKKFPYPKVTSHGGTFHVSKDVAPILSSNTNFIPKRNRSFESSPKSTRMSLEGTQKSQNVQTTPTEEALTIKSRTVSISARTILKQNEEVRSKNVNFCVAKNGLQEENNGNEEQAINQIVTEGYCPHSIPVHGQTDMNSSVVQHYYSYACPHCGGAHRRIATVQAVIPIRESCNMCRYQRLPTVNENNSYSPTDVPTKYSSCCPCPSPATPSSGDKLSPCSYISSNTARISSNQSSPKSGSPLMKRSPVSLEKNDMSEQSPKSTLAAKTKNISKSCGTQPSHSTSANKRSKSYSKKAGTPNIRSNQIDMGCKCKSTSEVKGTSAVFEFEPQFRNEEVQTQPYNSKTYSKLSSTSPNKYFTSVYNNEQNYTDSENNDFWNREPDYCLCETEDSGLRERNLFLVRNNSTSDQDTILPGAVDRSPTTSRTAEKYPHSQHSTIIVVDDDIHASGKYLVPTKYQKRREPTKNASENKHNSHRKHTKCTLM